jgi:hypothetical protein
MSTTRGLQEMPGFLEIAFTQKSDHSLLGFLEITFARKCNYSRMGFIGLGLRAHSSKDVLI